jgi:NADP-dependent aldehyde dehydrogenase
MELHGKNLIGARRSAEGTPALWSLNPATGERLEPGFHEATDREIDAACELASAAAPALAALPARRRGDFLDAAAQAILEVGELLLERTAAETALARARLEAERARTVAQLRLFAEVAREGSWVEARIDRADPGRRPPRPDLRRMLVPLGPVAVFGASNFPLAFSVAGGDTASALAAGCPVVVKAHPAHPGTSELVAGALLAAAAESGMPDGGVSLVHGAATRVGERLVAHPAIRAVAFTGSHRGGRALFDLAARRRAPIPVYAEMGSANPVFLLPGALAERGEAIAEGLVESVLRGAGQFCTNPGLTVLPAGPLAEDLLGRVGTLIERSAVGTVVHPGIAAGYAAALDEVTTIPGVTPMARASSPAQWTETAAPGALLRASAPTWIAHPRLGAEIYGPATLAVVCGDREELLAVARGLDGHLTATVHGTPEELIEYGDLLSILREKVGRLIWNGYPTGVEVCHAMQHGGPYPATTDARSTSVGTAAIARFARPVCWQDFPDAALPLELQNANPRSIWRLVDGEPSRAPV